MAKWMKYFGTEESDSFISVDGGANPLPGVLNELFVGRGGNDDLTGLEGGRDIFFGGDGEDWIRCGSDAISIAFGGAGNDTLIGATTGTIKLYGGAGADTFRVTDPSHVMDFDPSIDVLILL